MDNTQFLELFGGNICYCTLDDKRKHSNLIHYHEGFNLSRAEILSQLFVSNNEGLGVFFCVNEIDRSLDPQRTRTAKMLTQIRAIWADMDTPTDSPISNWPLAPSIIVNTSPGKYHYYWLTRPEMSDMAVEQWRQIMNGIANLYGSDANARDLVRVLRLPGFYHHKAEPFLSRVVGGSSFLYEWSAILEAFPPDANTPASISKTNTGEHRTFANYKEARESIVNGQNFHGAIMFLLNHWVNKGINDPNELKQLILDLLALSVIQDDRWEARHEDHYLDANIRDAIRFVNENPLVEPIDVEVIEDDEEPEELGFPPNLAGEAVKDILAMSVYPNFEISLVTFLGAVSGIVGRTFNVSGSGVNLYLALLGRTGLGKSTIKNTIHKVLLDIGKLNNGASFLGHSDFTSGKAMCNMFDTGSSKVCVMEEAGETGKSTLGNQPALRKAVLDIKTSSGRGKRFDSSAYSDVKNNTKILNAPALTLVRVSTPKSYIQTQHDNDTANTGELPRFLTLETFRDKPYPNQEPQQDFSPDVRRRFLELLGFCKANQGPDDPNVIDVNCELIDIEAETKFWVDIENSLAFVDPIKASVASRQEFKIRQIAAVLSIFNDLGNKIGVEEYAYAKRLCLREFEAITGIIERGAGGDISTVWDQVITPVITKIVNYQYKDPKSNPAPVYMGKGIFSLSNLHHVLKKNDRVKELDTQYKTGEERLLDYGLKYGMLFKIDDAARKLLGGTKKEAQLYRITDEFKIRITVKPAKYVKPKIRQNKKV